MILTEYFITCILYLVPCFLLAKIFPNYQCKQKPCICHDHNEDDITIMPIEEVSLEEGECLSLASKRLQKEEYWYKELATIYPYGL